MAENLIVRLEVAVDSVRRLVDSLDRGDQANDERIPHLAQSIVFYCSQVCYNFAVSITWPKGGCLKSLFFYHIAAFF